MHEERSNKHATTDATPEGALPAYLLDREGVSRSKILSNTVKQKRKEKAGKWTVPVPKVNPIADAEMFRVLSTGKRKQKQWKRMITKVTFVGEGFTRKPPKYERFVRPTGLRFKKAHVPHPELKTTFHLDIIGVRRTRRANCTPSWEWSRRERSSRWMWASWDWWQSRERSCGVGVRGRSEE